MIVSLSTLPACASRGAKATNPEPVRPPDDPTLVGNTEWKSIETLFAGRFPGVSVTRTDGGGLQIRIRGGSNSFYGSDEPLYIVDDTPLPPLSHGIVFLNPSDIERIEVLKNPADTGIYGVRGGTGSSRSRRRGTERVVGKDA